MGLPLLGKPAVGWNDGAGEEEGEGEAFGLYLSHIFSASAIELLLLFGVYLSNIVSYLYDLFTLISGSLTSPLTRVL